MDCSRIDDLLVDYIYQELNPAQVELFEAHLQGCARCSQEVTAYESTRTMLQGLPEEDPPPQISALLLQEASRAVQPADTGFWERLRLSMRAMVMHPAMTAAVTLMLVLGISFYVYKTNPIQGDSPKVDLPLVEDDTPTATITVKEGEGAGATTEKRIEDRRAAQPTESVATANEDERARDVFAGAGKGRLRQAPPAAQPPAVATRGLSRTNEVGTTRGQPRAQQIIYKDNNKDNNKGVATGGTTPVDNIAAPTQKQVLMPPPPNAVVAAGPPASASPAPPARKAIRKKARRVMGRKGPGVWDDEGVQGESQARVHKAPPQAARTDNDGVYRNKKEGKLADRSARAEQVKRPRKSMGYVAKPKPKASPKTRPAPRPTRVARRPALAAKAPAPKKPMADKRQAGKKGKQSNALNYLFAGNSAAQNGYCQSALEHFNMALTLDRSLRTRVTSAMGSCTRKMSLNQLLEAQKRHQMLAGLLEPDIKRARTSQYASRKARARKAKKAKAKARPSKKQVKSKSSINVFEAAPSAK